MSQNAILIGLILLPCAGALLLGALRGIRGSGKNFLVCAVTAAEFLMVLWLACSGDGTGECPLTIKGLFGLGAGLKSDGFRVLYGGIAAFMWLMTALFSGPYFEGHENQGRYYIFTLLTLASVEGLFFSADFYTAFVFRGHVAHLLRLGGAGGDRGGPAGGGHLSGHRCDLRPGVAHGVVSPVRSGGDAGV